jgi:hypothetical protein
MSYDYAKQRGFVVPFTGNLRVTRDDEGKISGLTIRPTSR